MRCVSVIVSIAVLCLISRGQESSAPAKDPPAVAVGDSAGTTIPAKKNHPVIEGFVRKTKFFPDVAENKEPLSIGGKFRLFALQSASPANITVAAAVAGIGQGLNDPEGYGQGGEGYGKRFGAILATGASTNFFGTFLIPSVTRQDPRFFRQDAKNFGQSVKYAFRHVLVTKSDKGNDALNWSGILAPIAAQSIANAYLPKNERTVERTFARSGRMIGITVGINFLKEYWPTISRRLRHNEKQ